MLGRYVQLVCGLPYLPLFDATDRMGCCERFCVGPAMHFTHRPLLWHDQKASDLNFENVIRPYIEKRVSLLIRHPLDTLVSLWMQRLHRVHDGYTGTLTQMIEDPVWGIEKLFRFYELWFEYHERVKDFLLVRYEDMQADTHFVFGKLLEFLAIPRQEGALRQAVADADFKSMKKMETSGDGPKYRSSGHDIFASGDRNNADAFHVRRGKIGGFYDYLQQDESGRLLEIINRRLPDYYGYSHESQRGDHESQRGD
jgi:hypothetical protein